MVCNLATGYTSLRNVNPADRKRVTRLNVSPRRSADVIMPTNLPPEALEAEARYRAAETPTAKIEALEAYISKIPKHKGTDKLRADLRRKLSKLKSASQAQKKVARHDSPYRIEREGAAQVIIVGMPNVGKSALLVALTNAEPEVAPFPFTTWTPTPGMMEVDHVQIQLIDTPPLNPDHIEPEMMELIRRADLVLLLVDLQGLALQDLEDAANLLRENRIVPRHQQAAADDVPRAVFVPFLVVVNKVDDASLDEEFEVLRELVGEEWPLIPVSATTGRDLDLLKHRIFDELNLIRVFAKPPGKEPDFTAPFVMQRGGTVDEFAAKVHLDFVKQLKSARVWGTGVYDGQPVGRDHVLHDGDVVELRI